MLSARKREPCGGFLTFSGRTLHANFARPVLHFIHHRNRGGALRSILDCEDASAGRGRSAPRPVIHFTTSAVHSARSATPRSANPTIQPSGGRISGAERMSRL